MANRFGRTLAAALFTVLLAGGAAGMAAPAAAQESQGGSGQSAGQQFSDAKLQAFAVAAVEVSDLLREWRPKIQAARQDGNQDELNRLREEANAQLLDAIKGADGITVDEYKNISATAREDKELYQRLNDMVKQVRDQQG